jgi:tRNA threonylcarbamoyladenosine biosynthesis protein TsaE
MTQTYSKDTLSQLKLAIIKPGIIFLYWDLWAWKTTLSQIIIQKILGEKQNVTSPTYVYYNKYDDIYHFDLYRLENYDQFISIGWEEILDNNSWVILVEWPELIEKYYRADIEIYIRKSDHDTRREIEIIYKKKVL